MKQYEIGLFKVTTRLGVNFCLKIVNAFHSCAVIGVRKGIFQILILTKCRFPPKMSYKIDQSKISFRRIDFDIGRGIQ